MVRRPPKSIRPDPAFPYSSLFRFNLMSLSSSDYFAMPLDPNKTARQSLNEISQSISLANKVRGEGNETRFGIVFNRVQTTSEVSKMLMEQIGQIGRAHV